MVSLLDMIGSTVLGGAVIALILGMVFLLSDSSTEFHADLNAQQNMAELTKSIQWDFAKIGHRVSSGSSVLIAKADTFAFRGDMDNNGTIDTVRYYKELSSANLGTPNPNDFKLYRVACSGTKDTTRINPGLTKFNLTYFDSTGNATTNPNFVRGLRIVAQVQNPNATSDSTVSGADWESTIYPRNLNTKK